MQDKKMVKIVESLWKSPNEKNWTAFRTALKGSKIAYYRVAYQNDGRLNRMQDLKESFVELFDGGYRQVAKVPLVVDQDKKVTGATKYLIGLKVLNRGI